MNHIYFTRIVKTDNFTFRFFVTDTLSWWNTELAIYPVRDMIVDGIIVTPGTNLISHFTIPKMEFVEYGFGHKLGTFYHMPKSISFDEFMRSEELVIPLYFSFGDFRIEMAPRKEEFLQTINLVCQLMDTSLRG